MDRKMIVFFSFIISTSGVSSEAPQLTCPSQTMSAEEGGRVKISVFMDPQSDMRKDRVNIERPDRVNIERAALKDVYVYIYSPNGYYNKGLQAAEYKNRTSVSEEDLIRGVLDLEIRNLSLKDSGSYRVSSSKYRTNCTFNISVGAKADTWNGAAEGRSQTETLNTVLLATVVSVIIIAAVMVYLWTSGRIRKM